MTITHRIALDPTDRQETRLRQHAGWARFAWNWGVAETRRALDAGENSATSHYRLRPAFNRVKAGIAPWSAVLSQNAAKYALIDLGTAWARFWRERREAREASRGFDGGAGRPGFTRASAAWRSGPTMDPIRSGATDARFGCPSSGLSALARRAVLPDRCTSAR